MYIWQVKNLILLFFISFAASTSAQDSSTVLNESPTFFNNDTTGSLVNKKRLRFITGVHITSYAGTMFALGQAWYKDYPRVPFQIFNDSKEWAQVDKVGHGWTAYNIAKYSSGMWSWTGLSRKRAVVLGGLSSIGYQTILEYLDAHSAEWGWSWTDMAANVGGTGVYVVQDLAWNEQRILFKFSSHKVVYEEELLRRADELYGKTLPERILKDYNGQTYWLSANIRSFAKESRIPSWLNIAVGYGAKGLFGGFENRAVDASGNTTFDRPDILRQRQWYISPDIDFTRIKTDKKGLKVAFSVLNMIKLPAPALELSGGKVRGRLFYF